MVESRNDFVTKMLASGFFSGYAPIVSGTFGTAAAIPFMAILVSITNVWVYLVLVIVFIAFACVVADKAERLWGEKDCSKIVIDEWAGYLVANIGVPLSLGSVVASFFIFRVFDVIKPYPASVFDQRVKGGVGVVMDDVSAGVYTWIVLQVIMYFGWI